jgi:anthraniloyl-CoA monooxygenase
MSIRISASDWAPGGLSEEDLLALARAFKQENADLIDVSTGQVVPDQKPVYGRMYQAPFADKIRNEIGIATMAVGNITNADQVNTIVVSGRADLVALARPHLADPYFTLHAAAWYQHAAQFWPKPYLPGREQSYRLAVRDREEWTAGREALKPPSHEVKDEAVKNEPAKNEPVKNEDAGAAAKGGGSGKKAA